MLGRYVSATVTVPKGKRDKTGFVCPLSLAKISGFENEYAYLYGADSGVYRFSGRIVAALLPKGNSKKKIIWIIAGNNLRPINVDILKYIDMKNFPGYRLKCIYETSCGAVVYRYINGQVRYLMIKNKRSRYWGWPKGHIEMNETRHDTARREVFEETGIHINIHQGFEEKSSYRLKDKTDKNVFIYVASTADKNTVIQKEEVDDYVWVPYRKALSMLKFQNDRRILVKAVKFLHRQKYIERLIAENAEH